MRKQIVQSVSKRTEILIILDDMAKDLLACIKIMKKQKNKDGKLTEQFGEACENFKILTKTIIRNTEA